MKHFIPLSLLLLFSCSDSSTLEKENELLNRELDLAKKELQLEKEKAELEEVKTEISLPESVVFSSKSFRDAKSLMINGKNYTLKIKRAQVEASDPPFESETTISFIPADFPDLFMKIEAQGLAVADINKDGKDEIICSYLANGTWASIHTFSLSSKNKWYEPVESYLWHTMGIGNEHACPTTMTWMPSTKQVKIHTSSIETSECSEQTIKKFLVK